MKALLDTNIIMDALQERQPFDTEAKEILQRGQNKEIDLLFTANAATDIFYLYSKARGIKPARAVIEFLLNTYSVVDITHSDCIGALKIPIEDLEDALVVECAKKAEADYIVTRDDRLHNEAFLIAAVSPSALLKLLK